MTAAGYFITGTDTGVGKTRVATGLIAAFQQRGKRVLGMKPVACGHSPHVGSYINDDVLQIAAITGQHPEDLALCPYSLAAPVSPNIAAEYAAISIEIPRIVLYLHELAASSDLVIVEGAGGWLVPISATQTMADVAVALQLPVILTVGLRLGCLNHALLTTTAIRQSGLMLAGWIANQLDPVMLAVDANIDTLSRMIGQPPLTSLPHNATSVSTAPLLASVVDKLSV
jgi:dethiobiotin synthetase